ncbi:MAG: 4-vinyl reductase [Beijerinckiaceae bacterium]
MSVGAPSFRERLVFDEARGEILDESRRYMLIRPEALMGIFRRLAPAQQAEALQAFAQSIVEQGSDSARAYQKLGASDAAALLDAIAATAPQLGWGIWSFERPTDDMIRLAVRNSPFAAGYGRSDTPVCHAIVGMMQATSTLAFGRAGTATEVQCAATGAPHCLFEARPSDSAP